MALATFRILYLLIALIALPHVLAGPSSPFTTVDEVNFNPAEAQVPILPNQDGPVPNSVEHDALNGHNDFRASHGASRLTWDGTLVDYAKNHASRCAFQHSGGPYGENLAAGTGAFTVTDGIKMWTDEAKDYDPGNPQPSHFTQVVWKSTKRVGCAVTTCPPGSIFPASYGDATLLWCNYDPPGNVIGQFPANVDP